MNSHHTVPELLFLKYKGISAPWEIEANARGVGFKCKKYSRWKEVQADEQSSQMLKEVSDSLLDGNGLDISQFGRLSLVWERVQRWTKDKENFSLEPDLLPEYDSLQRLITQGSKYPGVVDQVLAEHQIEVESTSLPARWLTFLAIAIQKFFTARSKSRFPQAIQALVNETLGVADCKIVVDGINRAIEELYVELGFDIGSVDGCINLFVNELGLSSVPEVTDREGVTIKRALPRVWLEHIAQEGSRIAKFKYSGGALIVQVNSKHASLSVGPLKKLIDCPDFWNSIGEAVLDRLGDIDDLQDFFDTWGLYLKNVARKGM